MKSIKYASQNLDKNDVINVTKTLRNVLSLKVPSC